MKSTAIFLMGWLLVKASVVIAEPLMYVPTGEANEVVIIDLKTDAVVGRIPELENAHGLAGHSKSKYLVAGSMTPVEVGVISGVNKPAAVSESEHQAHHAAGLDAATTTKHSYVSLIEPQHQRVLRRIEVRGITHHTAVSPDGRFAIAVHSGNGGISVIDLDKMAVVATIQTGEWPNYATFSADGRYLYVSNARPGTISEIDAHKWNVIREFVVGKEPEHMVLTPDGAQLLVANVGEGTVFAVDLKSGAVVKRFSVGADPHGLDISADGRWLFVSSKNDGKLVRIDLNNDERREIDLQPAPYHVAYVSELNKLYVSSRKLPKIWVLDPATMVVRSEINIGQGIAHQMVVLDR